MDDVYEETEGILIPRTSPERWKELKVYPLRPDDVFIATFPRSGTTWTQHTVRLLRNGSRDDGVSLDDAVPWLEALGTEKGNTMNLNPNAAEELKSPRSMKAHLPYSMMPGGAPHTTKIKYIYVARNPKDVCVSFWHFSRTQMLKFSKDDTKTPWDKFVTDFMEVKSLGRMYGGWLNHVLEWWKHQDEPNIMFLKYETMKKRPQQTVKDIAKFIGIDDISQGLVETVVDQASFPKMFHNSTVNNRKKEGASVEVTFLRKGLVGDWRNHFTDVQNEQFEEKIVKVLEENGLKFEYI